MVQAGSPGYGRLGTVINEEYDGISASISFRLCVGKFKQVRPRQSVNSHYRNMGMFTFV